MKLLLEGEDGRDGKCDSMRFGMHWLKWLYVTLWWYRLAMLKIYRACTSRFFKYERVLYTWTAGYDRTEQIFSAFPISGKFSPRLPSILPKRGIPVTAWSTSHSQHSHPVRSIPFVREKLLSKKPNLLQISVPFTFVSFKSTSLFYKLTERPSPWKCKKDIVVPSPIKMFT